MKSYTVGFVFNTSQKLVLLIHKNRPAWQKGALNGLGGILLEGETPEEGLARKVNIEANIDVPPSEWHRVGEVHRKNDVIYFLYTKYNGETIDATTMTDEQIEWFSADKIPQTVVPHSRWILGLAKDSALKRSPYTISK